MTTGGSVTGGAVVEGNFDGYEPLRFDEMPAVTVHVVPGSGPPGGLGEPGVPPLAPAVANAAFALTGRRSRRLPLRDLATAAGPPRDAPG